MDEMTTARWRGLDDVVGGVDAAQRSPSVGEPRSGF